MFIVITGNIMDGMNFYGPFESFEEALEYAEAEIMDAWFVAELIKPE